MEQPKKKRGTCPICLERKKLTTVSDGCRHLYCPSCIKNFFNHQLMNRIDEVKCPFPGCKGQIKNDEKFLGKKLYQQYLATRELPERIQCADIGCIGYIEFNRNTYTCEKCNKKICKRCLEYHNDQSCQDPRELASRREKAKKYVRCPLCKVYIERDGGCLNMDCRNCGKSYNEGAIRNGWPVKLERFEVFQIKHPILLKLILHLIVLFLIFSIFYITVGLAKRQNYCELMPEMMELNTTRLIQVDELKKVLDPIEKMPMISRIGKKFLLWGLKNQFDIQCWYTYFCDPEYCKYNVFQVMKWQYFRWYLFTVFSCYSSFYVAKFLANRLMPRNNV